MSNSTATSVPARLPLFAVYASHIATALDALEEAGHLPAGLSRAAVTL